MFGATESTQNGCMQPATMLLSVHDRTILQVHHVHIDIMPEFHVDRTHAAGGFCEQTKTALRKNI